MKKTLTILAALFIVLAFTATCMASTGNEHSFAKKTDKVQQVQKKDNLKAGKEVKQVKAQQEKKAQVKKQPKQKASQPSAHQKVKIQKQLQQQFKKQMQNMKKSQKQSWFKDVNNHWAAPSINVVYAVGLFSGYPDGTFKPDKDITQAEIIALVARLADYDEDIYEDTDDDDDENLEDVPAWVRDSVKKALKMKVINLNRFHSHVQATRAQTAVWIAKAIGLEPVDIDELPFKDGILISKEDVGYILALYQEGIIFGTPDGKFNPNCAITRAEIAAILERILGDTVIESVTLPETATVEQGKSITLKATVKYADGTTDDDVTWSSSNPELATVKNGVVTAADDLVGKVTITATATKDGVTKSASCKVTVVEKIDTTDATLEATGNIGINDNKVYQEFELIADGDKIDIDEDNVESITMTKDDEDPVTLIPNEDSTLWFNVQKESGSYLLEVELENGDSYSATLEWTAPEKIDAHLTGNTGEHNGSEYIEYRIGDLDLSEFSKMYQIRPDGTVVELTANTDSTLWFKTSNQQSGKHTFLIYEDGEWYTTEISFAGSN
ncbi:MAG: S-layer homology domain-containing protein [Syntrophomonadaceae bacterium]